MRTTALISPGLAHLALLVALTVSSGCAPDRAPSDPVIPATAVARVSITPASASVDVGATVQLAAVAYDAAGNPLQGRSIAWASSANTIASVSANGTVAGLAPGTATISAVAE
ncbi:MAG: Ig-like domain-containing protein, partial [Gemmatimonadaceae bacterium]|nr:Ig-like domain-containing protein [Gemmatimonadaceae bacterium]